MDTGFYQTGAYFVTSKWGTLFALGVALVFCYILFCVARFTVKRINERRLRRNLKQSFQHELQRVRQQDVP